MLSLVSRLASWCHNVFAIFIFHAFNGSGRSFFLLGIILINLSLRACEDSVLSLIVAWQGFFDDGFFLRDINIFDEEFRNGGGIRIFAMRPTGPDQTIFGLGSSEFPFIL